MFFWKEKQILFDQMFSFKNVKKSVKNNFETILKESY